MAAHEPELVTGLVELDRTSLRERAMTVLRNALAAREIPPGTRLVETELSTAMGISRGTLREALRQLEYEGLVEVGERGRLTVRTATPAELRDMFTVRAALEGLAASIVSARPDRSAGVVRLRAAVDSFESAGGSIGDVLDVDLAFHRLLCELTGNATLVRAWGALTGPIRMAVMVAGPDQALATMSAVRHRRLVDAIATGDPDTARSAVDAHLHHAARTLLDAGQDPSPSG